MKPTILQYDLPDYITLINQIKQEIQHTQELISKVQIDRLQESLPYFEWRNILLIQYLRKLVQLTKVRLQADVAPAAVCEVVEELVILQIKYEKLMVLEKQNSAFIDETLQLLSNENENQNGKQAEAASDLFSDDEDEMMKPQNEGLAALGIHAEMQREKGLAVKSLNDKVVQQELLEKHGSAPIVLTSKTAQEQLDDYRMENDVKITASQRREFMKQAQKKQFGADGVQQNQVLKGITSSEKLKKKSPKKARK